LSVDQAGLAITAGESVTSVSADFRCETEGAADEVKKLLERERFSMSKDLSFRVVGLGPLIDAAHVAVRPPTSGPTRIVRLETHAPTADVARAIEHLIERAPEHPSDAPGPDAGAPPDGG